MFEPLIDLELRRALIGATCVVAFLLRHEVIHIPMRQGDLILVFLAQHLLLGEGGWGQFGECVPETLDAAISE